MSITSLYFINLPSLAELKFRKTIIIVQPSITLVSTNQEQRNDRSEIAVYLTY